MQLLAKVAGANRGPELLDSPSTRVLGNV
jgi:hypothetical protein